MNKNMFLIILLSGLFSLSSGLTRQYHFVNINKTWTEALSYCRETYTDLASISDQNDQDSLTSLLKITSQAWIGVKYDSWRWSLEDTETDGVSNGWSGGYPWWQYGYTTYSYIQQKCVMMYPYLQASYGSSWFGSSCDSTNPFVCYDGRQNANQTFILVTQPYTWYQAQSYCREHYTDLATVRNQTENQAIIDLAQNASYYYSWLWIGLFSLSLGLARQYHFVNINKTWTEALSYCRETYTDLASVSDQNDQDSLNSLLRITSQAWIGVKYDSWRWSLEDTETDGVSNGWSGGYPWWQYGYTTYSYIQQKCVMMYPYLQASYGSSWFGSSCDSTNYFVCYDGRENANQTFVLVTQGYTWYQAQSYCREHYTDLAVVRNQTENQAIIDLAQNASYYYNWLWIGLYRTGTWSDGTNESSVYINNYLSSDFYGLN
ncbi:hypothetical protein DPEC_G00229620 [Dallia pectoralis]|uniref:Uncharacterized protein n=1 Tax=Dallia pectoralis TaxID=75939 RepID=A0ACC2G1T5_DALPE|nr:hypothetical protein DPEC_G00229620 [Dallia pectoralis]